MDSILRQTYANIELILVNDGSKDESWAICKEYDVADYRVKAFSKENEGVAATRNYGLSKVQGDYVLYVDSDDFIESCMVEKLLNVALKDNVDIVVCGNVREFSDGSREECRVTSEFKNEKGADVIKSFLLHKLLNGSLCNKLIKTSLFHNKKFDSEIGYGEDAMMIWNIIKTGNVSITYIPECLYHYRMNDVSISHNIGTAQYTALKVWSTINRDVKNAYPLFLNIARAKLCSEMTMIVYYAACSKVTYNSNIHELQKIILINIFPFMFSRSCTVKKLLFAFVSSISYSLSQKLVS